MGKTWVFTGFPWLFVGYAFTERLLMVMRHYLVSSGVVCSLGVGLRTWSKFRKPPRLWVIPSALLVLGAWGASKLNSSPAKIHPPLSVSLIQGNIPQDLEMAPAEYQLKTLESMLI